MENSKQPAFPLTWEEHTREGKMTVTEFGLTKREVFVKAAMQGILSNHALTQEIREITKNTEFTSPEVKSFIATLSVSIADEVLKQLEPKKD